MADKKKMSVAEILAAARKADGGGEAKEPAGSAPETSAPETSAPDASAGAPKQPAPEKPDKAKKVAPGGAGMSVADILAAARGEGTGGEKKAAKPSPAPQPSAAKTAPSAKEKPAAQQPAPSGPMDTASILAAARKSDKPGPISKAEAARRQPAGDTATAKPEKTKPVAPPMPAKPDYAKPKPAAKPAADEDRRTVVGLVLGTFLGMGFSAMTATFGLWSLLAARFMFPNVLTEPPNQFKVGFPSNFPPDSVDTRFKAQFGVWIVNTEYEGQRQIVALKAVCTHLGCTPNWLDAEQKFKCPCHGSGFYLDGINFEGPAPRPLERYAIRLADDGQIEVDKSAIFQEEMGQWIDPTSFVAV